MHTHIKTANIWNNLNSYLIYIICEHDFIILGLTFVAGIYIGRYWLNQLVLFYPITIYAPRVELPIRFSSCYNLVRLTISTQSLTDSACVHDRQKRRSCEFDSYSWKCCIRKIWNNIVIVDLKWYLSIPIKG